MDAEWDDNILMLSSDRGNWIALLKDDVVDVTSSVEETGFGYQVNTTTIFVGWAPNEALPEDQQAEGEGGASNPALDALPDPYAAPDFSLEQFVDPSLGAGSQPVRNF